MKMARWILTTPAVCCLTTALQADVLPKDLQHLEKLWGKTSFFSPIQSSDLAQTNSERLEGPRSHRIHTLVNQQLDQADAKSEHFSHLSITEEKGGARKKILKDLFTQKHIPTFCDDIQVKEPKSKNDSDIDSTQRQKLLAKSKLLKCRRQISEALGGIFHTDTPVIIEKSATEESGETLTLHIQSLLDENAYLKYQFQISN